MNNNTVWVRFFPSDWLAGTRGMTAAETGIYITLIAMMYERGGPLPYDAPRLARLCGASNSTFKKAIEALVADGKLTVEENLLSNKRVVEELFYSSKRSDVAKENAKSRWDKNTIKNNDRGDATALPPHEICNAIPDPYPEPERTTVVVNASARAVDLSDQVHAPPDEPPKPIEFKNEVEKIHAWVVERINSPSVFYPLAPVAGWLKWGADPELDIKPAVEAYLARGKGAPRSLTWLDEIVAKNMEIRKRPAPEVQAHSAGNGAYIKPGGPDDVGFWERARQRWEAKENAQ